MSEKELLYLTDIYNHEKLIVSVITDFIKKIKDELFINILENQLKVHSSVTKKIEKLMEGISNEG